MCFRVMPCYMSRNALVLMELGISTPRSSLNLIAIQKADIPLSCNPGRIGPIGVPKTCPHSESASSAATSMPFDAKGKRMTHASCVITQRSYKTPWSSSHPVPCGFQPILTSSQESNHIRRLCVLLGCFILQRMIQGSSSHTRKQWFPAYQFGHTLTLYSKPSNRFCCCCCFGDCLL